MIHHRSPMRAAPPPEPDQIIADLRRQNAELVTHNLALRLMLATLSPDHACIPAPELRMARAQEGPAR